MPGIGWTCVVALATAFGVAAVTTPAGVSGAVLLPPFQRSVLDMRIMAIAPTNLVYNIIATPGALYRYWRQGQIGGRLTLVLIAGTVPGVVAGCVIRAVFLPGVAVFDFIVAAVLVPLGTWLGDHAPAAVPRLADPWFGPLACTCRARTRTLEWVIFQHRKRLETSTLRLLMGPRSRCHF